MHDSPPNIVGKKLAFLHELNELHEKMSQEVQDLGNQLAEMEKRSDRLVSDSFIDVFQLRNWIDAPFRVEHNPDSLVTFALSHRPGIFSKNLLQGMKRTMAATFRVFTA